MQVEDNWVTIIFQRSTAGKETTDQDTDQVTDQVESLIRVLSEKTMSATTLMDQLKLNHRPTFRKNYLHPAIDLDLIEMTIPEKQTSRLQKYRLTKKGKQKLKDNG